MSEGVLLSVRPEWCELIAEGKKTLEIRKTKPKIKPPFKCFIYMTSGNAVYVTPNNMRCSACGGRIVIGEFTCSQILTIDIPYPAFQNELDENILHDSCVRYYDLHRYAYHDDVFGWKITELKIYDAPKQLKDFRRPCQNSLKCESCAMFRIRENYCGNESLMIKRPPQSWCYVEVEG